MAVLIREQVNGKEKKIYKTNLEKVTTSIAKKADELDDKIKKKIEQIEKEAESNGLIELKSKKGNVVKLYHFVGNELKPFVDNLKLSKGDKPYIWQAINYHSKFLKISESASGRLKRDPVTSTWTYCYNLGEYDTAQVQEYDWTQWVEIFDSSITTKDKRVVPWLIKKKKESFSDGSLQNWFRALMREIRNHLKDYDTTVLSDKELEEELKIAFEKFSQTYTEN
ncbi:hypothetical protein [Candidatus Nitrosopumilus sediminis]|uniref:Uncharacterized protein n=1 Tax=Candidatus Nitrosopumilus sediminis TaxID=1229909 RepID=K0BB32_9ARCH|nr:hypothetical protein [Candidatus Nitrosopumilus sediminis]AFS83378.1 hypothetical protein NSED_07930 [Candidatus Nitrosopumilus sediminis]